MGAAAAALALALSAPGAQASEPLASPDMSAAAVAQQAASTVELTNASYFIDDTGNAVVNVVDAADAAAVEAAGATPRSVRHSEAELRSIKDSFATFNGLTNTAWGLDPEANQVVVTISDAADKTGATRLEAAAKQFGDRVRIERTTGEFTAFIRGGNAITSSGTRCSAGFNVTRGGGLFVLTAGHCTEVGQEWDGLGTAVESDVPGADSALIENNSGDGPSEINNGQPITQVGSPSVGTAVTKSGSTTGITSGEITSVEQTVQFDIGVLEHMFGTTVDSAPGDSGGSGFSGSTALGTLSGGNATTTFFYPAEREFAMYGLSLP